MNVAAPTLTGTHVQLEQLRVEFAEQLVDAAQQDRSSYGWTYVPETLEAMRRYIAGLLDDQAAGAAVPFAQRRIHDGALVGCTRYLRLEWWAGNPLPDEVEVGGTWLAAAAQRTPINTEAKLLLLSNAFDGWNVHRVSICTDSRNMKSRIAIERIGATFEGILRSHRGANTPDEANTTARDTAVYSVIRPDWPAVRNALATKLQ
jgi:N-acetyltransferase